MSTNEEFAELAADTRANQVHATWDSGIKRRPCGLPHSQSRDKDRGFRDCRSRDILLNSLAQTLKTTSSTSL